MNLALTCDWKSPHFRSSSLPRRGIAACRHLETPHSGGITGGSIYSIRLTDAFGQTWWAVEGILWTWEGGGGRSRGRTEGRGWPSARRMCNGAGRILRSNRHLRNRNKRLTKLKLNHFRLLSCRFYAVTKTYLETPKSESCCWRLDTLNSLGAECSSQLSV